MAALETGGTMTSTGKIRLQVLGPLELRSAGGAQILSVLHRPQRVALLTYLALEGQDGFVRRAKILPVFWPESDEEHARGALRKALFQVRSSLGEDVLLVRESDELRLDPERFWCDAVAFRQACRTGELERALGLWTGDPLGGVDPAGTRGFDEWRDVQRTKLQRLATDACVGLVDQWLEQGRTADAVLVAREAVDRSPFNETVFRCLIRAMDASGDRAGALLTFETWAARLAAELGGAPAPETVSLLEDIRHRSEVAPAPATPIEPPPHEAPQRAVGPVAAPPVAAAKWTGRLRRWAPWATTVGVTVVLGVVALYAGPERAPAGDRVVAVLPFRYSGNDDFSYLGQGMMSLLGAAMEAGTSTRTLDHQVLVRSLGLEGGRIPDPAEAGPVVDALGATDLVTGSVVEMDGQIQLEASVFRRGRPDQAIQRAVVRGPVEDVFALTEELAHRLLPGVRDASTALLSDARLTQSLPALRAYLQGERSLEVGDFQSARSAFEEAVGYDSAFALAYLRLAIVRDWTSNRGVQAALRDAMRTSHRLSSGNRKLLDAFLARYTGDVSRAMALSEELVDERSEMTQAWLELGEVRFHYGAMLGYTVEEQVAPFRRVVELDPRSAGALHHIARVDVREADSTDFSALWVLIEPLEFLASEVQELGMYRAYRSGDLSALDSVMGTVAQRSMQSRAFTLRWLATASLDPDLITRYGIMFGDGGLDGEHPEAYHLAAMLRAGRGQVRRGTAQLLEAPAGTSLRSMLSLLATLPYLPSPGPEPGESAPVFPFGLSRADLEAGLDRDDPNQAFLLGLVATACRDTGAAAVIAFRLRRLTGVALSVAEAGAHNGRVLEAHLSWVRGDPAGALVLLGHAGTQPHTGRATPAGGYVEAHERFLRGESLLALGRLREALRWFGGFPEPGASDLHYLGITTLRRAGIHEALGETTDAIAAYEQFLELWESPDPDLAPLAEGAREALGRLRG